MIEYFLKPSASFFFCRTAKMCSYSHSKPMLTIDANWLMSWTVKNFANIDNKQVAALLFVTRRKDVGLIFKPTPVKLDDNTLIVLIGNMFDEKSTPAFIKIKGDKFGSCYVIQVQELAKIPNMFCPEIPLQADMIVNTVRGESKADLAMCVFPILATIPFGDKIETEVFNDTLVNEMKNISVKHGLWAKFVCDALEQNKNGPKTTVIAKRLLSSWNTKKSGDACRAATKRIWKTYVPIAAPFIETSLVTK
jgi:hypothetical protein